MAGLKLTVVAVVVLVFSTNIATGRCDSHESHEGEISDGDDKSRGDSTQSGEIIPRVVEVDENPTNAKHRRVDPDHSKVNAPDLVRPLPIRVPERADRKDYSKYRPKLNVLVGEIDEENLEPKHHNRPNEEVVKPTEILDEDNKPGDRPKDVEFFQRGEIIPRVVENPTNAKHHARPNQDLDPIDEDLDHIDEDLDHIDEDLHHIDEEHHAHLESEHLNRPNEEHVNPTKITDGDQTSGDHPRDKSGDQNLKIVVPSGMVAGTAENRKNATHPPPPPEHHDTQNHIGEERDAHGDPELRSRPNEDVDRLNEEHRAQLYPELHRRPNEDKLNEEHQAHLESEHHNRPNYGHVNPPKIIDVDHISVDHTSVEPGHHSTEHTTDHPRRMRVIDLDWILAKRRAKLSPGSEENEGEVRVGDDKLRANPSPNREALGDKVDENPENNFHVKPKQPSPPNIDHEDLTPGTAEHEYNGEDFTPQARHHNTPPALEEHEEHEEHEDANDQHENPTIESTGPVITGSENVETNDPDENQPKHHIPVKTEHGTPTTTERPVQLRKEHHSPLDLEHGLNQQGQGQAGNGLIRLHQPHKREHSLVPRNYKIADPWTESPVHLRFAHHSPINWAHFYSPEQAQTGIGTIRREEPRKIDESLVHNDRITHPDEHHPNHYILKRYNPPWHGPGRSDAAALEELADSLVNEQDKSTDTEEQQPKHHSPVPTEHEPPKMTESPVHLRREHHSPLNLVDLNNQHGHEQSGIGGIRLGETQRRDESLFRKRDGIASPHWELNTPVNELNPTHHSLLNRKPLFDLYGHSKAQSDSPAMKLEEPQPQRDELTVRNIDRINDPDDVLPKHPNPGNAEHEPDDMSNEPSHNQHKNGRAQFPIPGIRLTEPVPRDDSAVTERDENTDTGELKEHSPEDTENETNRITISPVQLPIELDSLLDMKHVCNLVAHAHTPGDTEHKPIKLTEPPIQKTSESPLNTDPDHNHREIGRGHSGIGDERLEDITNKPLISKSDGDTDPREIQLKRHTPLNTGYGFLKVTVPPGQSTEHHSPKDTQHINSQHERSHSQSAIFEDRLVEPGSEESMDETPYSNTDNVQLQSEHHTPVHTEHEAPKTTERPVQLRKEHHSPLDTEHAHNHFGQFHPQSGGFRDSLVDRIDGFPSPMSVYPGRYELEPIRRTPLNAEPFNVGEPQDQPEPERSMNTEQHNQHGQDREEPAPMDQSVLPGGHSDESGEVQSNQDSPVNKEHDNPKTTEHPVQLQPEHHSPLKTKHAENRLGHFHPQSGVFRHSLVDRVGGFPSPISVYPAIDEMDRNWGAMMTAKPINVREPQDQPKPEHPLNTEQHNQHGQDRDSLVDRIHGFPSSISEYTAQPHKAGEPQDQPERPLNTEQHTQHGQDGEQGGIDSEEPAPRDESVLPGGHLDDSDEARPNKEGRHSVQLRKEHHSPLEIKHAGNNFGHFHPQSGVIRDSLVDRMGGFPSIYPAKLHHVGEPQDQPERPLNTDQHSQHGQDREQGGIRLEEPAPRGDSGEVQPNRDSPLNKDYDPPKTTERPVQLHPEHRSPLRPEYVPSKQVDRPFTVPDPDQFVHVSPDPQNTEHGNNENEHKELPKKIVGDETPEWQVKGYMSFGPVTIAFVRRYDFPELKQLIASKGLELEEINSGVEFMDRRDLRYKFFLVRARTPDNEVCLIELLTKDGKADMKADSCISYDRAKKFEAGLKVQMKLVLRVVLAIKNIVGRLILNRPIPGINMTGRL